MIVVESEQPRSEVEGEEGQAMAYCGVQSNRHGDADARVSIVADPEKAFLFVAPRSSEVVDCIESCLGCCGTSTSMSSSARISVPSTISSCDGRKPRFTRHPSSFNRSSSRPSRDPINSIDSPCFDKVVLELDS